MPYVAPVIRTSGANFATLRTAGLAGMIDQVAAANTALANPTTQATVNVTGGGSTGGTLPAGAYFLAYTFNNGIGETTVGTGRSNTFTVAAGNIPRVTVPSLPTGASHINLYLTAAGGASGSEVLYYTGLAATTYDLSTSAFDNSAVAIPTANTTAATNIQTLIDAIRRGNVDKVFMAHSAVLSGFLQGDPMAYNAARNELVRSRAALMLLGRALDDILTLVDANRGTLGTFVNNAGQSATRRTFS